MNRVGCFGNLVPETDYVSGTRFPIHRQNGHSLTMRRTLYVKVYLGVSGILFPKLTTYREQDSRYTGKMDTHSLCGGNDNPRQCPASSPSSPRRILIPNIEPLTSNIEKNGIHAGFFLRTGKIYWVIIQLMTGR